MMASHPKGISLLRSGHSQKVFVPAAYSYVRLIPWTFRPLRGRNSAWHLGAFYFAILFFAKI